jgi:hypothetical protein
LLHACAAGRLDFVKALYICSGCGKEKWQSWADLLQLRLYPHSLHSNNQTFLELRELTRIRQELLLQRPTGWESRAKALDAVGARVYNQVGCQNIPCLLTNCMAELSFALSPALPFTTFLEPSMA